MPKKKTPYSVGSQSRFPYYFLWEEFAELWEGFGKTGLTEAKFEQLLADCAAAGHPMPERVSQTAIHDVLGPLELAPAEQQQLADTLYRFAAEYLMPRVRKALRKTPRQVEKRLSQLVRKATIFADALEETDLNVQVVLRMLRRKIENPANPEPTRSFFEQLVAETRDLAKAAAIMADEMPKRPQGTSVDLLAKRWVRAACRTIETVTHERIKVLQADGAGRNPRPKGTPAKVLFDYLQLVDPGTPDATKVRLILEWQESCREAQ